METTKEVEAREIEVNEVDAQEIVVHEVEVIELPVIELDRMRGAPSATPGINRKTSRAISKVAAIGH